MLLTITQDNHSYELKYCYILEKTQKNKSKTLKLYLFILYLILN